MRPGPEPGSPAEEGSEGAVADGRPESADRGGSGGAAAAGPGGAGADRPAAEQHRQVRQVHLAGCWCRAGPPHGYSRSTSLGSGVELVHLTGTAGPPHWGLV